MYFVEGGGMVLWEILSVIQTVKLFLWQTYELQVENKNLKKKLLEKSVEDVFQKFKVEELKTFRN